jgi:hypothetical protein
MSCEDGNPAEEAAPPIAQAPDDIALGDDHLTEALLADGHRVTVLEDLSTSRLENLQSLPDEFLKKVDRTAKAQGRSRSELI